MNYTVKPLQKQSEATEWEHAISAWKIKAKLHFVTTVIYFFSSQKCFSIRFQCWWAQCLPEMVGVQQASQWEVLSSAVSCWNTICLLPCSDLCRDLYSSVLLRFTSISGWRREESSDRLILDCFHSLSWHPVSGVIYTVAWWQLVYNAM